MSIKQGLVRVFDLHASQLPVMKSKVSSSSSPDTGAGYGEAQQYFEQARHKRAYDLYKQDIVGSIQPDPRSKSSLSIVQELGVDLFSGKRVLWSPSTFS